MSIKPEYFDYLNHYGETLPLRDYKLSRSSGVYLRHDVDYCIDTALELAFWEKEAGFRSSYFILPGASYWEDPRLIDKCLQIQDFGHEIGIHLNFITDWLLGGMEPDRGVDLVLSKLRDGGLLISGTSTHGDRRCYSSQFVNYWMFKELRPLDPKLTESGINAEGIAEANHNKRIMYPLGDGITSNNGERFDFWTVSMDERDLLYEASKLECDAYYSDSGGDWTRTPSPLDESLSGKKVQVLMHPIYWKAEPKRFFFLSPARSGSKWLSTMLCKASSCAAVHELTLNDTEDDLTPIIKATGPRFRDFAGDKAKVERSLMLARKRVDSCDRDYAECNVYLAEFIDELREWFPDALFVHLKRDPHHVVKSIFLRGWYDVPDDLAHPEFPEHKKWKCSSRFERCLIYVEQTNAELVASCERSVRLEDIAQDSKAMSSSLRGLGIAFYPLLAGADFKTKVNKNTLTSIDGGLKQSLEREASRSSSLARLRQELGYAKSLQLSLQIRGLLSRFLPISKPVLADSVNATELVARLSGEQLASRLSLVQMESDPARDAVYLSSIANEQQHASALLLGGSWKSLEANDGWEFEAGKYFRYQLNYELPQGVKALLYLLMYDAELLNIFQRPLCSINPDKTELSVDFASRGAAKRFNLAIYMPSQSGDRAIEIRSWSLCKAERYPEN